MYRYPCQTAPVPSQSDTVAARMLEYDRPPNATQKRRHHRFMGIFTKGILQQSTVYVYIYIYTHIYA